MTCIENFLTTIARLAITTTADRSPRSPKSQGTESHPSFDASDDLAPAQRPWYPCRGSYPTAQKRCRCLTHCRQFGLVVMT